jgi:hypothetical protein
MHGSLSVKVEKEQNGSRKTLLPIRKNQMRCFEQRQAYIVICKLEFELASQGNKFFQNCRKAAILKIEKIYQKRG